MRNSNVKHFTFWQQHISGCIQRRLDYFFISNVLQESVKDLMIYLLFDRLVTSNIFLSSNSEGAKSKR